MRAVVAIAALSAPRIVDVLAEPASVQLTVLALVRGSDATVRCDRQSFFELWRPHFRGFGARAPGDRPSFFEIGQLRSRGWHPECERRVPDDACRESGSLFPDVNPGIGQRAPAFECLAFCSCCVAVDQHDALFENLFHEMLSARILDPC